MGGDSQAALINSERSSRSSAPKDPGHLVYFIFYWLGMGSLLPWNFFIAVNGYWMHKFRNVTAELEILDNMQQGNSSGLKGTEPVDPSHKLTELQLEWNSYLSIASMIPNVTFLLLNAAFGHLFPTIPRLLVALAMIIVSMVFSVVMAAVDTDEWQDDFLIATLVSVVVINVMVAIFQGGLSGVAGKFPPRYMGAVVQGQGLGGIFAASTNVITIALGGNLISQSDVAFYCFLVTVFFLATALVALVLLMKTEFFKYYNESRHADVPVYQVVSPDGDSSCPGNTDEEENEQAQQGFLEAKGDDGIEIEVKVSVPNRINVLKISAQIWIWILAVFVNFMVTLAVFPAIAALVVSFDENEWGKTYFNPVGCFLLFNLGDFAGRIIASHLQWPKGTRSGAWMILLASTLRLAFVPLFLFCNASPNNREVTQVLLNSDAAYLVLMTAFSISSGYLGTICMMFAPKVLPVGESQATAASVMVAFIVLGLATGSLLSRLCVRLL